MFAPPVNHLISELARLPGIGQRTAQRLTGAHLRLGSGGATQLDQPVSHLSPWLDQVIRPLDEVITDLESMPHRRFIKTHTPLDGLPRHEDVTYVCVLRDPRDVAVSWGNHSRNLDWDRMAELRAAAHGTHDLHELPPRPEPSPDPVARWWAYMSARATSPEFATNLRM